MYRDDELVGLPDDFDINNPISILTGMIMERVPLSMYFYNYIKRLEEERAARLGNVI